MKTTTTIIMAAGIAATGVLSYIFTRTMHRRKSQRKSVSFHSPQETIRTVMHKAKEAIA